MIQYKDCHFFRLRCHNVPIAFSFHTCANAGRYKFLYSAKSSCTLERADPTRPDDSLQKVVWNCLLGLPVPNGGTLRCCVKHFERLAQVLVKLEHCGYVPTAIAVVWRRPHRHQLHNNAASECPLPTHVHAYGPCPGPAAAASVSCAPRSFSSNWTRQVSNRRQWCGQLPAGHTTPSPSCKLVVRTC